MSNQESGGGREGTIPPSAMESKSVLILYGSETGMAEDSAVELGSMIQRLRFDTVVDEMDSFKLVGGFHHSSRQRRCCAEEQTASPIH